MLFSIVLFFRFTFSPSLFSIILQQLKILLFFFYISIDLLSTPLLVFAKMDKRVKKPFPNMVRRRPEEDPDKNLMIYYISY